ncbi:MAG: PolC-type DNA polymerase III [Lachnospiraceae bacterium]|nr:PolC-type DNA polymerase III [Lachnospiraceae bacterium]
MAKLFKDVFPMLVLNDRLKLVFDDTQIKLVQKNNAAGILRIYLHSNHLIQKRDIYSCENAVEKLLFPAKNMGVKIYESFELPVAYNPENLYKAYEESILEELEKQSHLEYVAFKKADVSFEDGNVMRVAISDDPITLSCGEELRRILLKIFNERFNMPCDVIIDTKHVDYNNEKDEELELKIKLRSRELDKKLGNVSYADATDSSQSPKSDSKTKKGKRDKNKDDKQARPLVRSDNPSVVYGSDVLGEASSIDSLIGDMGEVIIRGQILDVSDRDLKTEKAIVMFSVTDFTDTIKAKIFVPKEYKAELLKGLKSGSFVRLRGNCTMDNFDHELVISGIKGVVKIEDFRTPRMDYSLKKRVELHCHTKMSSMDGVSEVKDIVKRAAKWGHRAVAITDHGVVQGFTDAFHLWQDMWKDEKKKRQANGDTNPDKQDFFKIIYGVECYLVDDLIKAAMGDEDVRLDSGFVVFDIETTGFSPVNDAIIEIGAVKVVGGKIVDRFSTFVNPKRPIPYAIQKLTSITDNDVVGSKTIEDILPEFINFVGDCALVAHNAEFDVNFIKENCRRLGLSDVFTYVDTLYLSRVMLPGHSKYTLDTVAKELKVELEHHHRAVDDAECTALIFIKLIERLNEENIFDLRGINEKAAVSKQAVAKLHSHHCIILAKNDLGRINLYRLISESHINYFSGRYPIVPKSLVEKYRNGLIVGSACEAGELYQALLERKTEEQIARIVEFYDYLEIQPAGNNAFMIDAVNKRKGEDIHEKKYPFINSLDDIREINKEVVRLGNDFHKPVVATCDVHFLDPEDELYRRIIMAGQGFDDADNQAPLFLHTTEEMLEEFSYLGSDKAFEVVVTNTNMIADMVESIEPVRPDKCPPIIADSDRTLRKICYDRAHELYGDKLPSIVQERLERELDSIIGNGFAVMYIIAQKLVWKSVEDGYLVGSRGSVGSSFVATMAGITEVNPLSPHYYCPNCHYSDFDSDEVKAYGGKAGVDMPDKECPVCKTQLKKDGFDIPFETFLGFKGDKEPDIDLNFSGEYQSKAHKYTEVIFGAGQTFRAGTIASLADKTAYGYVAKYYEERDIHKRPAELDRISKGCTGVRRSTGQHPGGIVVLPVGQDINSFTPVQRPANDMTTDTITTHFDYHSIDHNLLKLDILGHDDPTMIRMLQDLTGKDPLTIPLDGQDVMSLFRSTEALGITPDMIGGCKLGALGIPEFGTDFAMQMLIDTKPQAFSDLVRIAGLAHGTDVWLGNAEKLIKEGTATISTAICTRDDIMTYLISKGVDSEESFKIMENVRKGKVAKGGCDKWPEWKADMQAHDVPDWYIWSCEKILYMFPKAHAAAYVMMAWRIAYCKIHYPLAFYAAFFSIRAKAFDYASMCRGQSHLESCMNLLKKKGDAMTNKEKDQYNDMRLVQEMYARGFDFEPIDIFRVKARDFQIIDGKIMPSLTSIEGLGEKAADGIVEAAKKGPFLSKEDFVQRSKASKTVADLLKELGILGDIPESNQLSFFDFIKT